jgi:hypothetical protein
VNLCASGIVVDDDGKLKDFQLSKNLSLM